MKPIKLLFHAIINTTLGVSSLPSPNIPASDVKIISPSRDLRIANDSDDAEILNHAELASPPFEGAEKSLRISFVTPESGLPVHSAHSKFTGLRSIPVEDWDVILDVVKCKALITTKQEHWHSFVLSESSMFIDSNQITIKTCGRTNLLFAVDLFISKAKSIGFEHVSSVYYTRKAFLFPENQPALYHKWENEVYFLSDRFPGALDRTFGKSNEDHWHVFAYEPMERSERDCTLEILMTGMSPKASQRFYPSTPGVTQTIDDGEFLPGEQLSKQLGLDASSLLRGGHTDAVSFLPCGFSANLIGGEDERRYGTIHVTPESTHSYASFEANLDFANRPKELQQLVSQISQVFEPKTMRVAMFESHDLPKDYESDSQPAHRALNQIVQQNLIPGYHVSMEEDLELKNRNLKYVVLERRQMHNRL